MTRRNTIALVAGAALLSAAPIYASYRSALRRARARLAGGEIAQTRCGPIEYASAGDGPPVLFVHGAGGGFDQGLAFGRGLVAAGFRLIAMSRFGYLRTPLPRDASPAAQADAHAALLDALEIPRAAIIGGSAGAPSALQFALRHPERTTALVLAVPAAYAPRADGAAPLKVPPRTEMLFDTALRSDFLFWAATRLASDTLVRSVLATPPEVLHAASRDEQERVARVLEEILPVSARRLGLLNDAAVTSRLERYELEKISAPTLAFSVEDDLYGTYECARYTAAHIPNARFIAYPTGGHLWVGHQREAFAEIAAFLKSNAAPRRYITVQPNA
jgi:pimeloyl-ACP methyl ester carboxylesterase